MLYGKCYEDKIKLGLKNNWEWGKVLMNSVVREGIDIWAESQIKPKEAVIWIFGGRVLQVEEAELIETGGKGAYLAASE